MKLLTNFFDIMYACYMMIGENKNEQEAISWLLKK